MERDRIGACGRSRRVLRAREAAGQFGWLSHPSEIRPLHTTVGTCHSTWLRQGDLPAASAEAFGPKSPGGTPGHRHSQSQASAPWRPAPLF